MKQIKHTMYSTDEPMTLEAIGIKLFHVFEWANKMGREGKVLTGFSVDMTSITCVEFVTDDQYAEMLLKGTITEHKEQNEDTERSDEGVCGAESPSDTKELDISKVDKGSEQGDHTDAESESPDLPEKEGA